MKLAKLAVVRPVSATVLSLLILVLGLAALYRLPVREYPDIDDPTVTVTVPYPGASAEVVEREVTQRIEEAVSAVEGVRRIRSQSRDGRARIEVELSLDRDLDLAAADVRDRISTIRNDLPDEAEEPRISQRSLEAQVIMWLVLTSDALGLQQLSDFAERTLVDSLSNVSGVASVLTGGDRRYAMRIWLDLERMASRGVTVLDVEQALLEQNLELPAGRLVSETRELTVRTMTELERPEQYRDLILRSEGGAQITLGDVARIEYGPESLRTAARLDGEEALGLGIVRQTGSNTLAVADGIRKKLAELDPRVPESIDIHVAFDESDFIAASIFQIVTTLFLTIAVVVFVVYLSLASWRSALVPSATIPSSVAGALIILYAFGFSLNVLTLLALILAIGMLIDDSIVVAENVFRHTEQGEPGLMAGERGGSEVAFAVLATTVVLISVIAPLALLTGDSGRLFTEFAAALGGALAVSSLVALTLGTMLASRLVHADQVRSGWLYQRVSRLFDHAGERYARLLEGLLAWRRAVIAVALALAVATIGLYRSLPRELVPTEDRGAILIPIEAPRGTTLEAMLELVAEVESLLAPLTGPGQPGRHVISLIAPRGEGEGPVSSAILIFRLQEWGEREVPQQELVRRLIPKLRGVRGAQVFAINPPSLGQEGFSTPVRMVFSAGSREQAYDHAKRMLQEARRLPSLAQVRLDHQPTSPQLRLRVNRTRAAELGISIRQIGRTLQIALGGEDISDFAIDAETYEVMLRAEGADRAVPEDLQDVHLRGGRGELVPLSSLIEGSVVGRAAELYRTDRLPSVTLEASLASGAALGDVLERLEAIAREKLPADASIGYLGQSEDYQRSSAVFLLAFGLALVIVYLVLAAQFESFIQPVVLLAGVPLAVLGGLLSLWLAGETLNIFSQIGLILAIGLMAKNAILLVELANQYRDRGQDLRESLENAARTRFRPILMTSFATLFGALPLVLAVGAGSEVRSTLGLVILGGVISATLMALLLVPPLYLALAGFSRSRAIHERELARQQEREPRPAPVERPSPDVE